MPDESRACSIHGMIDSFNGTLILQHLRPHRLAQSFVQRKKTKTRKSNISKTVTLDPIFNSFSEPYLMHADTHASKYLHGNTGTKPRTSGSTYHWRLLATHRTICVSKYPSRQILESLTANVLVYSYMIPAQSLPELSPHKVLQAYQHHYRQYP